MKRLDDQAILEGCRSYRLSVTVSHRETSETTIFVPATHVLGIAMEDNRAKDVFYWIGVLTVRTRIRRRDGHLDCTGDGEFFDRYFAEHDRVVLQVCRDLFDVVRLVQRDATSDGQY